MQWCYIFSNMNSFVVSFDLFDNIKDNSTYVSENLLKFLPKEDYQNMY